MPVQDPAYSFDQEKLDMSTNAFQFLRSYVDYFYLFIRANPKSFLTVPKLQSVPGWCVGDAHPENFGVLIQQDGQSLFTVNDIDDSGPCPIGLDLLRLIVSSTLSGHEVKLENILNAYTMGLQGKSYELPPPVSDLIKKSQKKGTAPNPKKIDGQKFVRDSKMHEVSSPELAQIKSALSILRSTLSPKVKILDVVSTRKNGGGSGGLLRYEILLNNGGSLLHLELKEEILPAIYPVATEVIPKTGERIAKTLRLNQPANASVFYAVVQVSGKDMLVRPRFDGNVNLNLDKQSDEENKDIILYEAFTLGLIHSRSISTVDAWIQNIHGLPVKSLKNDASLISRHFEAKFLSLKTSSK